MGFKVLEILVTPNPNAKKFILDAAVSSQPLSFFSAAAAKDHAVASKLFAIPGVTNLLLLGDFVTVSKEAEARWETIAGQVVKILKSS